MENFPIIEIQMQEETETAKSVYANEIEKKFIRKTFKMCKFFSC